MNKEEFVLTIKQVVVDSSIKGVVSTLEKPSGRRPAEKRVILSKWYNNLDKEDKEFVLASVKEAVESAVFGMLCVLDGVRAIEGMDKGILKLYYEKRNLDVLLNDPKEDFLHDIFLSIL